MAVLWHCYTDSDKIMSQVKWLFDIFNRSPAEPDMPCVCKWCRSDQLTLLIWICTVCHTVSEFVSTTRITLSDWLTIKWAWHLNLSVCQLFKILLWVESLISTDITIIIWSFEMFRSEQTLLTQMQYFMASDRGLYCLPHSQQILDS